MKISFLSSSIAFGFLLTGCALVDGTSKSITASSSTSSSTVAQSSSSGPTQSTSVPTVDAIAGRIQKGIPTSNPAAGNFKTVLAQVQTNLPLVADPTKATGLDQVPLLVYAACSDIKASTYNVNTSTSVTQNMANLVAAGVTMVNQHVGGLAATGTALNQQVAAVFTTLANADMNAGASTATTFISVCLAANSFGVGMVGF